jgi:RelA/SpoT family (p)ppGpp synthetase
MESLLDKTVDIHTIDEALALLKSKINTFSNIEKAYQFALKAHDGQYRKSSEPYIIHPILVASIVAEISHDEEMVQAALLHDVVEDTDCTIDDIIKEFGKNVANLVEGLTKIVELRDQKLIVSDSSKKLSASALSFRKLLIASIKDVRVIVIKLCDRIHNMQTLQALSKAKQLIISEETLLVYAPIAHRLGISMLKNKLEDYSFFYLLNDKYKEILDYKKTFQSRLEVELHTFMKSLQLTLDKAGYDESKVLIHKRIKHNYSVHLKMQRKGIGMEEVLDLLAVRILVDKPLDCYTVLGLLHLNYKFIPFRFKDYIAVPKENGYQSIHSSIFNGHSIVEVQIRTKEMHKMAEFGVAAHWRYKLGNSEISLDWLKNLHYQNDNVNTFYELVKNDLYVDDMVVFTPKGDPITLPLGSTGLDFAYAIHSDVGNMANTIYINNNKSTLLTQLHENNIIEIILSKEPILRCTWIDTVRTSKAKESMRSLCNNRLKAINTKIGFSILSTILNLNYERIQRRLISINRLDKIGKIPKKKEILFEIVEKYLDELKKVKRFSAFLKKHQFKLKNYDFDSISVISNSYISTTNFDHCCHPKYSDEIMGLKINSKVYIHHKTCEVALENVRKKNKMVYVYWRKEKHYKYHILIGLVNSRGVLASFLQYLAKLSLDILSIELGKNPDDVVQYCSLRIQSQNSDKNYLKLKIEKKAKVIEFSYLEDAYR